MTIEARTAIYGSNGLQQPRRDSTSSNGYQDSPSEDDGYFTSAVSVQHKVRSFIILHFNMGIHWRQKKILLVQSITTGYFLTVLFVFYT